MTTCGARFNFARNKLKRVKSEEEQARKELSAKEINVRNTSNHFTKVKQDYGEIETLDTWLKQINALKFKKQFEQADILSKLHLTDEKVKQVGNLIYYFQKKTEDKKLLNF